MWRLVREGLRFYTSTLLISWAVGIGILTLVLTIVSVVGSAHDLSQVAGLALQAPLAILIASMVAGFIALGTERNENRVRLHVALPVRIREVALARVLLPTVLVLAGLALSHVVFAALLALEGFPALPARQLDVDFVAATMIVWLQFVLAAKEVAELRHRVSWARTLGGKALLVTAAALTIVIQVVPWSRPALKVVPVAGLAVLLMIFTVVRFGRRTQFTR